MNKEPYRVQFTATALKNLKQDEKAGVNSIVDRIQINLDQKRKIFVENE